ncbi:hypothetical protein Y5S_03294 [Alcanivorax nanhaiticus]|uniref:Uncharacterized protein n=1 Tax=Alcanivorax nanhaiticus TaxID=1177154 RepID=A0A095ULU1_9GAMM|nr:hypothetical protein [Alcanivorax nanhaiticus]KGD63485.1 hypothetical protein Y5S_03294 [Alcanivorax nanhaiticus]
MVDKAALPNVVLVGFSASVFVSRTAQALSDHGIQVSILDPQQGERGEKKSKIGKLFIQLRRFWNTINIMRSMDRNSTVIVLSLPVNRVWLIPLLKSYFKRVTGIAFGSDILHRNVRFDGMLGFALNKLDAVCATNENVLEPILTILHPDLHTRASVIRFGLPVFDELNKLVAENVSPEESREKLGFRPDRNLIALGYNAVGGQRQIQLMDAIEARIDDFSECDFVIPVQYGEPGIEDEVKRACERLNNKLGSVRFYPLTRFYDPVQSAHFRRATTVMINHSVSDAFSGSVQETIYAGNLVLAASHLPYKNMPGFGTAIKDYSNLQDAFSFLEKDSLNTWRKAAEDHELHNRTALHEISSWDAVMPSWISLVRGESGNG